MASASSADVDAMELEAVSCFSLHQFNEAEQLYRQIMHAHSQAEDFDAARRDQYNLGSVLVRQRKFDDAEPLLRDLLAYLEARSVRNRKHFMQQEAATTRLLVQTLGERQQEEATRLSEVASRLEAEADLMGNCIGLLYIVFRYLPLVDLKASPKSVQCEVDEDHPIDPLVQAANQTWTAVIKQRTYNVRDGAAAYRARRGRHPPPWFDRWYDKAQSLDAIIVEEFFDQIYRDMEPFWAMDPRSIRASLEGWQSLAQVRNGRVVQIPKDRFRTRVWGDMLKKISLELPDMDIALNGLDEPRVLVPFMNENMVAADVQRKAMMSLPTASFKNDYPEMAPPSENPSGKPRWNTKTEQFQRALRESCPPESLLRATGRSELDEPKNRFVHNVTASSDICQNPSLLEQHGFLIEPASVDFTTSLLPIFSAAKLGNSNDILLPEPAYYSTNKLFSGKDWRGDWSSYFPWRSKINQLVWRGAATGGHARADTWKQFHRHRFVSKLNASSANEGFEEKYGPTTRTNFVNQEPLADWLSRITDVGLSKILCDGPQAEQICTDLHQTYKTATSIKMGRQYKWKYLADIDGNTLSGRFRAFMRSNSAVMKATIFTEWHDSRFLPWKHYIPLGISFDGIYDVMAYFLGIGRICDHDAVGEKIANDGQKWANTVLRKEDMLVYMHRALLEYARIVHDDRDHLGHVDDLLDDNAT